MEALEKDSFCPKCNYPRKRQWIDCPSCGVVYEKYNALQNFGKIRTKQFEKNRKLLWEKVLVDFDNLELHERYIEFCRRSNELEAAIITYRQLREANPHDEILPRVQKFLIKR